MALTNFMNDNFPGLELRPALFYNWDIGIRFELGVDYESDDCYENSSYLQGVYKRAITLLKALHRKEDEVLVVVNVNDHGAAFDRKLNVFSTYIRDKSVLYKLTHTTVPYVYPKMMRMASTRRIDSFSNAKHQTLTISL